VTRTEWAKIWNLLLIAYPNRREKEGTSEKDTITLYHRMLDDLPTAAVQAAALTHISQSVFFPSIAELRKGAMAAISHEQRAPLPHQAWAEVKEQVRISGYAATPTFSHPLIERAIEGAGGYKDFCMSELDQEMSWRAQFLKAYELLLARETEDALVLPEVRATIAQLADKRRLRIGEGAK
jgi:hypothetical protein